MIVNEGLPLVHHHRLDGAGGSLCDGILRTCVENQSITSFGKELQHEWRGGAFDVWLADGYEDQ